MCEKCRTAGAAAKSAPQRRQEAYAKAAAAKSSNAGAAARKAPPKKSATSASSPLHKPAAGKPSTVRPSTIASSKPSTGKAAARKPATQMPAKQAAAESENATIRKSLLVDLQIDPTKASALDDSFTLYSTDGSYKQTKTVKDDKEPGDKKITLEFTDLVDGKLYTLEIDLGSDGMKYDLFTAVPFADIAA